MPVNRENLTRIQFLGRRVLCPGGVLCLLGYELPRFVWTKDPSKEEALNAALMDVRFLKLIYPVRFDTQKNCFSTQH